jgi:hypothetical protein
VAGCSPTYPRLDALRALPEATLAYPGSEEVAAGGSDGGMTIDGPQGAFSWRWLGADASDEEIERFYAEELGARGWTEGGPGSGIRSTGELRARAWRKGDVVFRLAFPDPEQRADPEPFSRYQTIYDARLQESDRPRSSPSSSQSRASERRLVEMGESRTPRPEPFAGDHYERVR